MRSAVQARPLPAASLYTGLNDIEFTLEKIGATLTEWTNRIKNNWAQGLFVTRDTPYITQVP